MAFGADGKTLAAAGYWSGLAIWDLAAGKEQAPAGPPRSIGCAALAFSPDGKTLACGALAPAVRGKTLQEWWAESERGVSVPTIVELWETATGKLRGVWAGHNDPIMSLAFSPDGRLLASVGLDRTARVWDVAGAAQRLLLSDAAATGRSLAFSRDGKMLAACVKDTVTLWDTTTGAVRAKLRGQDPVTVAVAFHPAGRVLAGGGVKAFSLWDFKARRLLHSVKCPGGAIALAFSPSGELLASGGVTGEVRLWDVPSGREVCLLKGHRGLVNSVAFTPDCRMIASGCLDGTCRVWSVSSPAR